MNVAQLQRLQSLSTGGPDGLGILPQTPETGGSDFGDTFKEALGRVDEAQKTADAQITAFVAGEQENVSEVMIAMNEAKLAFQLMTEVRNRMLETYQELMRMQV
jgi:flagellar hook-basal body complex protein FliE